MGQLAKRLAAGEGQKKGRTPPKDMTGGTRGAAPEKGMKRGGLVGPKDPKDFDPRDPDSGRGKLSYSTGGRRPMDHNKGSRGVGAGKNWPPKAKS